MKLFSYTQLTKNEQDAMNGFKMALNVLDPTIYRVHIDIDTKEVNVLRFGIDVLDDGDQGNYNSIDDLPSWIQGRMAVLCMTSLEPPTPTVEGVGKRIDEQTYWVVKDIT